MRALASYIMRGQLQAITAVVACAVLALPLMPLSWPLSYLSAAGVGLVALVQGPAEGGKTVLGACLITALLTTLIAGTPALAFALAMTLWIPAWLLASMLRQSRSLALALQVLLLVGLVFVAGTYLVLGDPAGWWHEYLTEVFLVLEQAGISVEKGTDFEVRLKLMSSLMTGTLVMMSCWGVVAGLLIARWWQSQLYKPGAFGEEFRVLRLGKPVALGLAVLALLMSLMSGIVVELALNMLLVAIGIILLQGLAVAHTLVMQSGGNVAWLVMLYVLLIFAVPYMLLLLVFVGLVDNWLDLRSKLQPKS